MAKRGRKPSVDVAQVACPNPDCRHYGELGGQYIVANGSYNVKGGKGQRYKCKSCKKSFCHRSGTIFHDLRTPEEKVILTIKLLLKGMTIRKVADLLKIKTDTVRHWLALAYSQKEAVNQMMLQELGVSQTQLNTLWDFVKNNKLHDRAVLWRKKCGWR